MIHTTTTNINFDISSPKGISDLVSYINSNPEQGIQDLAKYFAYEVRPPKEIMSVISQLINSVGPEFIKEHLTKGSEKISNTKSSDDVQNIINELKSEFDVLLDTLKCTIGQSDRDKYVWEVNLTKSFFSSISSYYDANKIILPDDVDYPSSFDLNDEMFKYGEVDLQNIHYNVYKAISTAKQNLLKKYPLGNLNISVKIPNDTHNVVKKNFVVYAYTGEMGFTKGSSNETEVALATLDPDKIYHTTAEILDAIGFKEHLRGLDEPNDITYLIDNGRFELFFNLTYKTYSMRRQTIDTIFIFDPKFLSTIETHYDHLIQIAKRAYTKSNRNKIIDDILSI